MNQSSSWFNGTCSSSVNGTFTNCYETCPAVLTNSQHYTGSYLPDLGLNWIKEVWSTLKRWFCDNANTPELETGKGILSSMQVKYNRMEVSPTPTDRFGLFAENSTSKECINIMGQKTRLYADVDLFCFENGTIIECRIYPPEMCWGIDLHSTPTMCSESNSDLIANMSKKVEKSNVDEFRSCVQRGSHVVLHREKLSYDHHMLVSDVYENSIRVIEYAFPEGLIDRIDTISDNSVGQIQYRTITFEELLQSNASKVYLVYSGKYPITSEQLNTAMERATSRIGEHMYFFSHNNCENFVTWALTGISTSSQWRDASAFRRLVGDGLEKICPVAVEGVTNLLLQNLDQNVSPKEVSVDRSPSEDETIKRSINDPPAPNKKGSKLSSILERFIYCIKAGNIVLAIIYLLWKLVIFYMKWGHSPGGYSLGIIMIVGFKTFIFIFGIRLQLFEIEKLLFQNFISAADLLREMFKIMFVYLARMTPVSYYFFGPRLTISETCVLCLCQLACFILAGILFDAFIYLLYQLQIF